MAAPNWTYLLTVTLISLNLLTSASTANNSTTASPTTVDPKPILDRRESVENVTNSLKRTTTTTSTTTTSTTTTAQPESSKILLKKNVTESVNPLLTLTTTTSLPPPPPLPTKGEKEKKELHKSLFKWNSVVSGQQNSLSYKLNCTPDYMSIEVNLTGLQDPFVYLEKLKAFSICRPKIVKSIATFHLTLDEDFYRCGTVKVHDQVSGTRIYYNRVIVESKRSREPKSVYFKCSLPSVSKLLLKQGTSQRSKRQLAPSGPGQLVNFTEIDLPDNFMEAEILDFDQNITARAPYPHLGIRVKRNGQLVNTSLNVAPGTPLEMIIYLDDKSKHVYGLLASFMKVTDNTRPGGGSTSGKEEVIVLNGCSIDPYIFGNFETDDGGDSVSAKFRAFKFPESNYVMFVGTVNVCLDKCLGVPCGNDVVAFGRRRKRSLPTDLPSDPNKVFEIEMTTYLQIGYTQAELDAKLHHRPSALEAESAQQPLSTNSRGFKPARLTSSPQTATPQQGAPVSSKLYDSNKSAHLSLPPFWTAAVLLLLTRFI